ncbi:hypothetical protein B296_00057130 [Ensete ventricosum]|uniref:Uncharacterized protein n=1 Tax=Ensete ventricosum TaxID=4639 RepID=A0A426WX44_ENSVE|nr:hypothetical protein B296_00057130 [Ensete ventricosum]
MSTSLVWQPSRSTSLALVVVIASIGDTISLIIALCIVSTPPKKGPQHYGPEVREEREAHLHYSGFLIFSFGSYYTRYRPPLLQQLQSQLQPSPATTAALSGLSLLAVKRQSLIDIEAGDF